MVAFIFSAASRYPGQQLSVAHGADVGVLRMRSRIIINSRVIRSAAASIDNTSGYKPTEYLKTAYFAHFQSIIRY